MRWLKGPILAELVVKQSGVEQEGSQWASSLHVIRLVQVPGPPPLALGVFVASDSLSVDLLALLLPAQVLLLLLSGDAELSLARQLSILGRHSHTLVTQRTLSSAAHSARRLYSGRSRIRSAYFYSISVIRVD